MVSTAIHSSVREIPETKIDGRSATAVDFQQTIPRGLGHRAAGSEGFGVQFSDYLPMIFALIAAFAVVVGVVVMIRRRNEP